MILGPKLLLKLVKEKKLVEGLSKRELTNPEGAGFDLRLGEVYKISGEAFLGETERKTPDIELVAKYEPKRTYRHSGKQRLHQNPDSGSLTRMTKTNSITFQPGDYFLVKTVESFNMPENLTANFKPRTTTFRSGLFLRTGNVSPCYKGPVTFGMKNEGPIAVTIEMGARFVHVQFEEVKGGGSNYRGQWQGGRVSTTKKEVQI